ncbi:MAG: hypothetical protein A3B24_02070 [Candidatus Wildermuthbacteria bacterium RIFCSPLOWO2_01_FULL_48_16]|uniref:BioF2-like acetyltransferase domain-containing protein n=1 Tax=Candidatus Wildermuthbacteria bacterium RIFCSPLOWO2_01_FULL_48_16 TaxID=1802461 RepID=A0A1G2RJ50_9BACT|nr:MAG: hypothetical protein A3J57_00555 [Candidatus Wildermuthbacteria bacterium RIFCSPHIGHO2_02_FULL_49_12b]OHA72870.1 MAG: hypothetical protein A3B24_02070 [Candidatus Wildermuthbacteria bacterium RIFCSPLOWO2_01_FULL_48_16]
MEAKEITNKETWETFFLHCRDKTFLQAWQWGEFHARRNTKFWRFGIYEDDALQGVALVAKIAAKRGTFLLIQHGPVLAGRESFNFQVSIFKSFTEELKKLGNEEGADFIRIAPLFERTEESMKLFRDLGFREAPMHASAYDSTWKLDITTSEGELLRNMRKTTRYLIRQTSSNPDIRIEKSADPKDIEKYETLNLLVAEKQQFVPFSKAFIADEFAALAADGNALWLFGMYKDKVAAAALVVFWSGIGFYHQAASDPAFSKFSIPYLLQWEAIKEAKQRGCAMYDFWGYADPASKHPWAGPTLFKMGFGGRADLYVKTQDLVLSQKYWLTYLFELLRKLRRGL